MSPLPILLAFTLAGPDSPPAARSPQEGSRAGSRPEPFALKDGDRVVMLGGAFIERDGTYGYLETLLTSRLPDRDITFRNLGWSGDTVFGEARARFGTAAEGFAHLKEHVLALKPTVLLVAYGMNESFEGPAGLPKFVAGLHRLLDTLAETNARVVLISPNDHERLGPPLPDPTEHRAHLRLYRDVIAKVAAERGCGFIDLFKSGIGAGTRPERAVPCRETDDGIHLNAYGYLVAAEALAGVLAPNRYPLWHLEVGRGPSPVARHDGTTVQESEFRPDGARFVLLDDRLADLPVPPGVPAEDSGSLDRTLIARDLDAGRYTLKIDGQPYAAATAEEWAKGVRIGHCPERRQAEALRRLILEKNGLYFHRWRPQNETYLFGFRKHEQGQNAREIPRFDPLVAAKEAEIARLRRPVPHQYELARD